MSSSQLISNLQNGINTAVSTSCATSVYYLLSTSFEELGSPLFIITKNDSEARRISDELGAFFSGNVLWYPKHQLTFHDLEAESSDIRAYRLKAINAIIHD